jgi:hypothetical protein
MTKKRGVLIAVLIAALRLSGQVYFPVGALSSFEQSDKGRARWYSAQLKALDEPSLLETSKNSALQAYRFVWLRTFHHPVVVRLDVMSDGSGILTVKITNGAGGYEPGKLIENTSVPVTRKQTEEFLKRVNSLGFWELPSFDESHSGFDGSRWIIEGVKDGKYHVADRWTPGKGSVHDLGAMLAFTLARLKIPKDQLY